MAWSVFQSNYWQFCRLQGGKHSGNTGLRLWWSNLGLRWRYTKVVWLWRPCGLKFQLCLKKCKTWKIFREAIGSNGDQIRELVGLLEVVGYKRIWSCGLWNLPKIPRLSWGQVFFFESKEGIPGFEGGGVTCRIVLKFQGQLEASISLRVRSGSLRGSKKVWCNQVGESSMMVDGKLTSPWI